MITEEQIKEEARKHAIDVLGEKQFNEFDENDGVVAAIMDDFIAGATFVINELTNI